MNPAKLKAYVDQQSENPDISSLVGAPPSSDDDLGDDDELEDEPEVAADPLARGNELLASWGEQGETLKESAGEIVDGAHEVGGDLLLGTVPEEKVDEVHEQFDRMPDDMQIAIAQRVAPLSPPDCTALATALIDGHDGDTETADAKLVCTYLQQLAAYGKDEIDPDDFVKDEDEDDGDDDDGGDDAADAPMPDGAANAAPVDSGSKPLV